MLDLEDVSSEGSMRELAEILASGYLRLKDQGAMVAENSSETVRLDRVTADNTNGCSTRNLSDWARKCLLNSCGRAFM